MLRGCQRGAILQIRAVCLGEKGEQTEALEDDLQNLLDQYKNQRAFLQFEPIIIKYPYYPAKVQLVFGLIDTLFIKKMKLSSRFRH
jgi:hypothetical protein